MLQRWSGKGSTFWKACNKENTWEYWMCSGCNQQRSATDSWQLELWSTDSKNYCVWDFDTGSQHETCHRKFVLKFLLLGQKEHHASVADDLIQTATNEPDVLKKVITGDESWVHGYACDLERKTQSSQWELPGFPCLKKAQQSHSKIKTILSVCVCVFLLGRYCPS